MIISASRRTDIPAFFTEWFLQKLDDGQVQVANPMNPRQVRTVSLERSRVTAFVFWSKNPRPFYPALDQLDAAGYPYYIQYTLNDYPETIEPGVPSLRDRLETLKQLSERLGPDRIVWRYDPILFTEDINEKTHVQHFARLADCLSGYVNSCTFSFYAPYRKTSRAMRDLGLVLPDAAARLSLVQQLTPLSTAAGIALNACCVADHFAALPVQQAACIDPARLERITGQLISRTRDRGQRSGCHCIRSVDIGMYRTCHHGCRYCYAGSATETQGRGNT